MKRTTSHPWMVEAQKADRGHWSPRCIGPKRRVAAEEERGGQKEVYRDVLNISEEVLQFPRLAIFELHEPAQLPLQEIAVTYKTAAKYASSILEQLKDIDDQKLASTEKANRRSD